MGFLCWWTTQSNERSFEGLQLSSTLLVCNSGWLRLTHRVVTAACLGYSPNFDYAKRRLAIVNFGWSTYQGMIGPWPQLACGCEQLVVMPRIAGAPRMSGLLVGAMKSREYMIGYSWLVVSRWFVIFNHTWGWWRLIDIRIFLGWVITTNQILNLLWQYHLRDGWQRLQESTSNSSLQLIRWPQKLPWVSLGLLFNYLAIYIITTIASCLTKPTCSR